MVVDFCGGQAVGEEGFGVAGGLRFVDEFGGAEVGVRGVFVEDFA